MRILRLSRNFGKEIALTAGVLNAQSDAIVMMDADLEHPVETVHEFIAGWISEGYDVVYGYRRRIRSEPVLKRLSRRLFYRLIYASRDASLQVDAGDFRLLSRKAYMALRQFSESQRLMKGLYSWIGYRQKAVPYTPEFRREGRSKYSNLTITLLGIDGITSFSIAPLRLAIWTGLIVGTISCAYGLWTMAEKFLFDIVVPGYPTIIVLISMIGAVQLIFLGVVGEYIGKILLEVKGRPLFLLEGDEHYKGCAYRSARHAC